MVSPDTRYIEIVKSIIAEKIKLNPHHTWKQRDFENLINLIYGETRIKLSLSTLKRIWQKGYTGTPHPSTLDALARYAGYENWHSFKVSSTDTEINRSLSHVHQPGVVTGKMVFMKKTVPAVTVAIIFLLILFLLNNRKPAFLLSPSMAAFDSVPAEIIFQVETQGRIKDSLFIIPSQRPLRKIALKRNQREIKYRYSAPGYYTVTLNYGDRVVDSSEVLARTNGWMATVYNYNRVRGSSIESYFSGIEQNGTLSLKPGLLESREIPVDGNLFTLYYYVTDPFKMDYDNFVFETRIKADSVFNYPYPYFYIALITQDGLEYIPFISPGNETEHSISFSDSFLEGNTNSLFPLATDVYSWNNIRIENLNKQVRVFVNGSEALRFVYRKPINPVCGFSFTFLGTGTIESVHLSDCTGRTVYDYR